MRLRTAVCICAGLYLAAALSVALLDIHATATPARQGSLTTIREDIAKDRMLSRMKPKRVGAAKQKTAGGKRWKEGATGNQVVFCETCGCPVVDSDAARALHLQRMPSCGKGAR